MVLALLATSCARAEETAPAVKEAAPAIKEAAPAVKEAAPVAAKNMVKVTLKKLDGTPVEKLVEKPRYGGELKFHLRRAVLAWDEVYQAPWVTYANLEHTNEDLIMGDWARGPAGTEETTWWYGEILKLDLIAGELAESWEHPQPGTLIFHIRKGVKWALDPNSAASRLVNGREFTADDAAWNIKRIYIDTSTAPMYAMLGVARPTEVYATDKYTVVVKAPEVTIGDTLLNIADLCKMVPPEVVKKYGDMNQWENVVGTGPFILTDYVPMSSATWVRNPNYWMKDPILGKDYPLPYLDSLKMLIIPDRSTELAALRTGKLDIGEYAGYKKEEWLELVKTNPNLKYVRVPPSTYSLPSYTQGRGLPFDDIRVRKALTMAVDTQAIIDTYWLGDAARLTFWVPPHPDVMMWYTPFEELPPATREIYTYNPQKAKQLLAEAGYPNGFKTQIVISAADPEQLDIASVIKDYWAKNLGVDLALDVKEYGVRQSMFLKKTYKEMMFHGGGEMIRSAWYTRKDNGWNIALVDDPKCDQLYWDLQSAFFDEPKRDKIIKEGNLYILSNVWYLPLPRPYLYRMYQPWLKNYRGERGPGTYSWMSDFRYWWLDLELKKSMGH